MKKVLEILKNIFIGVTLVIAIIYVPIFLLLPEFIDKIIDDNHPEIAGSITVSDMYVFYTTYFVATLTLGLAIIATILNYYLYRKNKKERQLYGVVEHLNKIAKITDIRTNDIIMTLLNYTLRFKIERILYSDDAILLPYRIKSKMNKVIVLINEFDSINYQIERNVKISFLSKYQLHFPIQQSSLFGKSIVYEEDGVKNSEKKILRKKSNYDLTTMLRIKKINENTIINSKLVELNGKYDKISNNLKDLKKIVDKEIDKIVD